MVDLVLRHQVVIAPIEAKLVQCLKLSDRSVCNQDLLPRLRNLDLLHYRALYLICCCELLIVPFYLDVIHLKRGFCIFYPWVVLRLSRGKTPELPGLTNVLIITRGLLFVGLLLLGHQ